ncbi:NrsF family protein [Pararhodobacter oceanensis]|uniref:RNA polymerase subunit sigma-70 n=1 Tax=Pararhodobacter oceanensis TaxID=2172121 RepID=A0A2T8HU45_9RHOB|nr:DUF1109 domain-containing protein [Pararhodobacter oceanensis]PVH28969.1 RNA polymerase subunit sigma-70 [Pararhodobacter oceanensis]
MRTEDLIAVLAADTAPQTTPGQRMLRALPPAAVLTLLALVMVWQVRPDLAQIMASPAALKTIVPSLFGLVTLWLGLGVMRPESRARVQWLVLGAMLAISAAVLGAVLATVGLSGLIAALDTPSLLICFLSIPLLSALPLAAIFWAMASGAPAHPRHAGIAAGALAGAIGSAAYSLHCPEDSLLFCLPAYGANMVIVAVIGGLLAPRILRW